MRYLLIYHNNYLHHQNWGNRSFCKKKVSSDIFYSSQSPCKKKKKEKHNELFFLVKVLRKKAGREIMVWGFLEKPPSNTKSSTAPPTSETLNFSFGAATTNSFALDNLSRVISSLLLK